MRNELDLLDKEFMNEQVTGVLPRGHDVATHISYIATPLA